jgi:hypothetical protein
MSTELAVAELAAHAELAALRERRQAVGRVLSNSVRDLVFAAMICRERPDEAARSSTIETRSRSMIAQCSEALVRLNMHETAIRSTASHPTFHELRRPREPRRKGPRRCARQSHSRGPPFSGEQVIDVQT